MARTMLLRVAEMAAVDADGEHEEEQLLNLAVCEQIGTTPDPPPDPGDRGGGPLLAGMQHTVRTDIESTTQDTSRPR